MKSTANILILAITMVSQWNFCDKLCLELNRKIVSFYFSLHYSGCSLISSQKMLSFGLCDQIVKVPNHSFYLLYICV